MTQDLFDWLNSTHADNNNEAEGISLLLVPVNNADPEPVQEQSQHDDSHEQQQHDGPQEQPQHDDSQEHGSAQITALNDAWQGVFTEEASSESQQISYIDETSPDSQYASSVDETIINSQHASFTDETSLDSQQVSSSGDSITEPEQASLIGNEAQGTEYTQHQDDEPFTDDEHTSILNQAWHEATGFHLNLNEPPPQMWTDIDDSDDEDEPKDYEETSSLQGDAYIPVVKHGANFTQRLQATLKTRKDKAAQKREHDAENSNPHPYVQKAVLFCGVMLMALGFAYFGLWFIRRETPDNLTRRARSLYEQGKFGDAAILYQRGCKRYPHILTFLTGLARSAEKAGHTQTAIAAWNEYMSSLPKDDTEHRRAAQDELNRLIPGGETRTQIHTVTLPQKTAEPQTASRPQLPEVRPLTFDEALAEGNNAFNIGMFSRAIANFHKAHAIRPDDIRPYIGLAASYRAKGMYFDSKRLIDEARKKFGRDPSLEIEMYYLRRE